MRFYPNTNGDGDYAGELHVQDYGVHIHLLEEWNEVPFNWFGALVEELSPVPVPKVRVLHPFVPGSGCHPQCMAEAVYNRDGEGDLVSLVVHDAEGSHALYTPADRDRERQRYNLPADHPYPVSEEDVADSPEQQLMDGLAQDLPWWQDAS